MSWSSSNISGIKANEGDARPEGGVSQRSSHCSSLEVIMKQWQGPGRQGPSLPWNRP